MRYKIQSVLAILCGMVTETQGMFQATQFQHGILTITTENLQCNEKYVYAIFVCEVPETNGRSGSNPKFTSRGPSREGHFSTESVECVEIINCFHLFFKVEQYPCSLIVKNIRHLDANIEENYEPGNHVF